MWILDNDGTVSQEELRNKILSSKSIHTVYILDGPTRCGKTYFLKNLPQERTIISGFHLLYEQLIDSLRQGTGAYQESKRQLILNYRSKAEILCFEDIDMALSGRPNTQEEFARIICEMSEFKVVILTGIEIKERCSDFVKRIPILHYCKWIVE